MTDMKQKIKDFIARFLQPVRKKMTGMNQKIKPFFANISRIVRENPPRWKYVKKNFCGVDYLEHVSRQSRRTCCRIVLFCFGMGGHVRSRGEPVWRFL